MGSPFRAVHRVLVPGQGRDDLWPLYATGDVDAVRRDGRRSFELAAGRALSLGSYVNAFPASYWQRWTSVSEVVLRLRVAGSGTVAVHRSDGGGTVHLVTEFVVGSAEPAVREVPLPLSGFPDGGWYWFDLHSGESPLSLAGAEWLVPENRPRSTVTIGITTFNRPKFCTELLASLAAAPEVLAVSDRIVVVDLGTTPVRDHPGFAAVAQTLGERLHVVRQDDLGCAGGFARVMAEALEAGTSDHVLLLDDDVALHEPESILRAMAFADHTSVPTIVGGHMFDLLQRSVLHLFGDTVDRVRWWTAPSSGTRMSHDLAKGSLADTGWLHRRADVDFNGWWLCLIPTAVVRRVGLTLPCFIKWDDVEYGLRAAGAGHPTVSLPGVGVWHMPWYAKDVATDWQVYFQSRNRIITALVHSPHDEGGAVLDESLMMCLKYALTLQESAAELMLHGLADALKGSQVLHADDGATLTRLAAPGAASGAGAGGANGKGRLARRHPELVIPFTDRRWWLDDDLDAVLVTAADGVNQEWAGAGRDRFRALVRRARDVHGALRERWDELAADYRRALPDLVSADAWSRSFTAASGTAPARAHSAATAASRSR